MSESTGNTLFSNIKTGGTTVIKTELVDLSEFRLEIDFQEKAGEYKTINQVLVEGILEKHKAVFDEKNETITEFIAKLRLKDNAQPILYALKDKVEAELDNIEEKGLIKNSAK